MKASPARKQIVIAGGGFAGLYAAKYLERTLARRADVEVTLISRENFILFTPMLHEIIAGDLSPGDIVNPLRRILRRVQVIEAEIDAIDLDRRKVRCFGGLKDIELELPFDHLLIALGGETNFFGNDQLRDWSVTMKNLTDAALLRNRIVALLEEASLRRHGEIRPELLTYVVAGGGFAGVETTGAINDFTRAAARFYPRLRDHMPRVVVVEYGNHLLPELGEKLGRYTERKLREREVEVITGVRVNDYDGVVVKLSNGTSIPAATLVWTAGTKPSSVIEALPLQKERGRLLVDENLRVPEVAGLWAAGDCAAVPDSLTGGFCPPTAQHGLRQAVVAAKNMEASIAGETLQPFRFKTLGLLASIGHHTGVAMVLGFKFSGFAAWWMWRTIYLSKLPRLAKKLRVAVNWTFDLFFGPDIEQGITARDIEATAEQIGRVRARRSQILNGSDADAEGAPSSVTTIQVHHSVEAGSRLVTTTQD